MPTYTTSTTSTTVTLTYTVACTSVTWTVGSWYSGAGTVTPTALLPRRLPTPEQRAEDAANEERARRARERTQAERRAAQARARALLLSALTPEQQAQYATDLAFLVHSPDGRIFRIRRGRARNIQELNQAGEVIAHYCAHPAELVPDEDTMLTQLLYLQNDPDPFLRIANRS